jgi:hypothetical protein
VPQGAIKLVSESYHRLFTLSIFYLTFFRKQIPQPTIKQPNNLTFSPSLYKIFTSLQLKQVLGCLPIKQKMKTKRLSLLILLLLLQACAPTPLVPSLERAVNFEKGISKIPQGNYLFLEFRSKSVCSNECNCAPEAPAAPLYEITPAGELWIERDLGLTSTGQSWLETGSDGRPSLYSPILGFFVFNAWGGRIYVMDILPFTLRPGDTTMATVYNIDAQGTAVVEVYGETYFIKPGQSWIDSGDRWQEPPAGCHVSYNTSLVNLGLFSQSKIHFAYPNLKP